MTLKLDSSEPLVQFNQSMSKLISLDKIWLETPTSITMNQNESILPMRGWYGNELDIVANAENVVSNAPLWNG